MFLLTIQIYGQKKTLEQKNISKVIAKSWDIENAILREVVAQSNLAPFTPHGKIFEVQNETKCVGYLYSGRVFSCRSGGCSSTNTAKSEENSEYFDYIILFDNSLVVSNVRIYNYQATHGQEVCSPAWLKQFVGHEAKKSLEYGDDIDAISGATISAISVIADIEFIAKSIEEILRSPNKLSQQ